jgi:ABC-2 type transport system permease protein
MRSQTLAILWAQWKSIRNNFPRTGSSDTLSIIVTSLWYLAWTGAAAAEGLVCAESDRETLSHLLPSGLLLLTLYWQLIPILMVSTGLSLDLRKLVIYPVPHSQLFSIEVMLRVTTAAEMLLMLAGALIGLLLNPRVPGWGAFSLLIYIAFNLFLSTGLRDQLGRLLARKRVREVLVFGLVLLAALPQLLLRGADPEAVRRFLYSQPTLLFPWFAAGRLALGIDMIRSLCIIFVWTAAAYAFARWQFERSLRFDITEVQSRDTQQSDRVGLLERLFRILPTLLRDPLGVLVEKEIRLLTRSARFRLVFLMGFSFGLLIWLPIAFKGSDSPSPLSSHYLTAVTIYAVMLLGEVCIWNIFGFDRSAVQLYYSVPVRMSTVIIAKNITAGFFITLEVILITLVCYLFRMPITIPALIESFCVAMTMTVFLLAIGNLMSTRNPRSVDPDQSWRRNSAGRVQATLIFIYLMIATPIGLAYAARFAFHSDFAFYAVLSFDLFLGMLVYWIAMESAVATAMQQRESIIAALSRGEGPVS